MLSARPNYSNSGDVLSIEALRDYSVEDSHYIHKALAQYQFTRLYLEVHGIFSDDNNDGLVTLGFTFVFVMNLTVVEVKEAALD